MMRTWEEVWTAAGASRDSINNINRKIARDLEILESSLLAAVQNAAPVGHSNADRADASSERIRALAEAIKALR